MPSSNNTGNFVTAEYGTEQLKFNTDTGLQIGSSERAIKAAFKKIPYGIKSALLGDSRFYQGTIGGRDLSIWAYNLDMLLGGAFNISQHIASGGKLFTNMMTEQIPLLRKDIGMIITDAGINDIIADRRTLAQLKAAHADLITYCKANDLYWLDSTSPTCNTLTVTQRQEVLAAFNTWRLTNNHGYSKYYCIDQESYVSKPDLTAICDNLSDDGLHLNMYGSWIMAYSMKPDFSSLFEPVTQRINYGRCILPNPTLSGSVASGFGPAPELCGLSVSSGATVVSSIDTTRDPAGLWKVALTGSAPDSTASLSFGSLTIKNWASGLAVPQISTIIKPTVYNGYVYRAINAGSLASGSDPTGTWPKSENAVFTNGSVTLIAMPAFSFQTHLVELWADLEWIQSTGNAAGVTFTIFQFDNAGTFLTGSNSPSFDIKGTNVPLLGAKMKLIAGDLAYGPNVATISPQITLYAPTGVTTTAYISNIYGGFKY